MIYIYDIESYVNFFCVTFKEIENRLLNTYTIYSGGIDINQLNELYNFVNKDKNKWLVGYNSKYFDNQILNYIYQNYELFSMLSAKEVAKNIHDFMLSIIEHDDTEYKYRLPFKSIDLMRVGNVERKALKLVAVNLNWPKIQDLPYKIDAIIRDEDLKTMWEYNLNDVEITERLYHKLIKDINVRWNVGQKYKVDLMSESDSGIANRLTEKMYSDVSLIPIKDLKEMRTERKIIHYENIVFEDIFFESDVLKDFLEEIKSQVWYKNMPYFNKTVVFDGAKYKLGIGGIHSDDKAGVFVSTDQTLIIDCDVTSMYPSIMLQNHLYPAHLSSLFLHVYEDIIKRRITAKNEGNEEESYALKICLNSVFGKTLYQHHWLYDTLVGLRVTINGQLYMLMLIEALALAGFKVISANTDGLITLVPKDKYNEYIEVCQTWEIWSKLKLEYTNYSKYIRKDVNNYITIKEDGSTKEKGDFLSVDKISLRQGIDKPIISKALYNYFVKGIAVEETIYNDDCIYNFCIAKKTDAKFVNEFHTLKNNIHHIEELQKTVRFYISTNGGTLYKVDRDNNKYINYCVNHRVTILNDNRNSKDIKDYNIDYSYYIYEVHKIINTIIDPQLTLW